MNTITQLVATFFLSLAAACATVEKPQTFPEQVAYVEAGTQAAIKTVGDLTCLKYLPTGVCEQPGKPIAPARAKGYLDTIAQARTAVKAVGTMPAGGGACLGSPSTPTACLALASSILAEVQKILTDLQKTGG